MSMLLVHLFKFPYFHHKIHYIFLFIFPENPLGVSWHDSAWIPILSPANIMDYFSERSNPFYDRTCNNEMIKMQRLSLDQLTYVFIYLFLLQNKFIYSCYI